MHSTLFSCKINTPSHMHVLLTIKVGILIPTKYSHFNSVLHMNIENKNMLKSLNKTIKAISHLYLLRKNSFAPYIWNACSLPLLLTPSSSSPLDTFHSITPIPSLWLADREHVPPSKSNTNTGDLSVQLTYMRSYIWISYLLLQHLSCQYIIYII